MDKKPEPLLWPFPQWDFDEHGNFRMVAPAGRPKRPTKAEQVQELIDDVGEAER